MKSLLKIAALAVLTLIVTGDTSVAQERGGSNGLSPDAMVSQTIFNSSTITVTYGRPGLKGRELSSLTPAGEVWRTGANEASTITFSTDVNFGGEPVPAGTYTLYTIPGENWTFILNNVLTRDDGRPAWGAYGYDESQDQVRVPAAVTVNDAPFMERFAIYFDELTDTKTHLNLHWGTTKTAVPITID
ncbi:MAG: DUF2911 domain-containing protein [bacterium]|nr:DUF2911 domain-containing protein [bacterium]